MFLFQTETWKCCLSKEKSHLTNVIWDWQLCFCTLSGGSFPVWIMEWLPYSLVVKYLWNRDCRQTYKVSESLVFVEMLFGCTQEQAEMDMKSLIWILNSAWEAVKIRELWKSFDQIFPQSVFSWIGDLLPRTHMKGAEEVHRWQEHGAISLTVKVWLNVILTGLVTGYLGCSL